MNQTGITSTGYTLTDSSVNGQAFSTNDLTSGRRRLLSEEDFSRRDDTPRFRSMMRMAQAV